MVNNLSGSFRAAYNDDMASVITSPSSTLEPLVLLPPAADGGIRITREGYWRLIQTGVFGPRPRIELVDGEILMMSPIGPMHGTLVRRLSRFFIKNLPEPIECSVQLSVIVADHSEPEPDIALIRHRDDDYQHQHPSPPDIVLLVEVAQTSASRRFRKEAPRLRSRRHSGVLGC